MTALMDAPTIPRLFTALAEWLACVLFVCRCRKRLTGAKLYGLLALALAVQCAFLCATGEAPLAFWFPCMGVAVGMMFALLALCCDLPLAGAGYGTVRAFLLAEFAASLEWQLYCFFAEFFHVRTPVWFWGCLVLVYAVVYGVAFWVDERREDPPSVWIFRPSELWAPVTIGLSCFLMSNLSFVYSNTPFTSALTEEIYNIRTLVDLAGVFMMYSYHAQRGELLAQREVDAIQLTLQNQYAQYCQSRESIDAVNRKYHDLKHQIVLLRSETDSDKQAAFLDRMEAELAGYENQNKTGSPVLDTVLTGKSLQCARHQVELTCVADGALLEFMDVMDICTLFGNILDNAIEHEVTIDQPEKRLIALKVFARKGFVVIQCENYCPQPPEFRDGLPVTTKADKANHGYGVKSIRYTAEKYGGSMTIQARNEWFQVNVLLPVAV